MRKFVCNDCGGVSYSSAALENQKHPECIHCGHLACKEVPMTTEDLTPTSQSSDGVLKSTASNKILYQCDPERNSSCAATGCYLNGGPCRHTTDPAFAIPGAKGVPAKELLAVSFREVFDDVQQ